MSPPARIGGGSDSTGSPPAGCRLQRTSFTRFDWRATNRITEMATPASTAYCIGTSRVSRKVTDITTAWVRPVRHTMTARSTLNVRIPITISSAARAGIAMNPAARPKARMVTTMTTDAVRFATRPRPPAATTREVADIDPPTGMPWNSPEARLATPWPTKSREGLG